MLIGLKTSLFFATVLLQIYRHQAIEDAGLVSLLSEVANQEASYFVRLGYGYAHDRGDDEEETEREQDEAFGCSCLEMSSAKKWLRILN